MEKKTRKRYNAEEKVAILRMHLLEKVPISDLCDQHLLHPTMFYRWQKEFFENGSLAFNGTSGTKRELESRDRRMAEMEVRLAAKNEVIAELMQEHVALKKRLGGA
ncbi:MAG: DNA-binding protein of ISPca7 [Magnetococcales bacterium]|nr:DNA-binding protein of ISPca7 [Magnetococcales bacterium]